MRRFTNDRGVIRYWGTGNDDLIIMHAFPRKAPDMIEPQGLKKISLRARHYTPGRVLTLNTYVTLFYSGKRPKDKWIIAELMKLDNLYSYGYLRKYNDVERAMLLDIRDEDGELYSSEAAYSAFKAEWDA